MRFVLIFGAQAVGKMTVGEALMRRTGLKLFHNHMTIELVSNFFSYGSPEGKRLVHSFREQIFDAVAGSSLPGLIFTYVWAFDMTQDWDYVAHITNKFEAAGAEVYYVELVADMSARIERNRSEHRLAEKPSKRNTQWSENELINSMSKYRLVSQPGEITYKNYMRIDNTNISPDEAADMIVKRFGLQA